MQRRSTLEKLIILLIVAYISPTIAAIVLGAWVLRYVYELGRSDPR